MNSTDYAQLTRVRERIYDELERLGYKPKRDGGCYEAGEDIKKCSAQWRLRNKGEKPQSITEVEWALCEAICIEGGYVVFPGDGIGCAAQMVMAAHERADEWEAKATEVQQKNEILQQENKKLKQSIAKVRKELELYGRF